MALTATDSGTGLISTSKIVILDALPTLEDPPVPRLLEDGTARLLEDGTARILE